MARLICFALDRQGLMFVAKKLGSLRPDRDPTFLTRFFVLMVWFGLVWFGLVWFGLVSLLV